MSKLLAYIGNDPERLRCALHAGRARMVVDPAGVDCWGIGFYQGGEVLLRRRPKPPEAPIDFFEVSRELRTDALIGMARATTGTPAKNEDTPPFRFRSWLGAQFGTLSPSPPRDKLLAATPDFLRRNVRGQTDAEHVFHLFLAHLHGAGRLDDPMITPAEAGRALAGALTQLDEIVGGDGASPLALMATNGRILVGATRGQAAHLYRVEGVRDCPVCRDALPTFERERMRPRAGDHDHLRAVVVLVDGAAGEQPPWQPIPDRHLVTVSHQLQLATTPL